MCGRFALTSTTADITKEFAIDEISAEIIPGYNIAPSQMVSAIINDGKKRLVQFNWGFIPSWAKDPSIGNKMINARSETLIDKPSFKTPLRKRRCLIISDGFYEWKKEGNSKTPYFIRLKSKKTFCFAGLFDIWKSVDGCEIKSCVIITACPNEKIKPIHNRMPVIIPMNKNELWLSPDIQEATKVLPLLKPYPSDEIEYYEVSREVNSPANDSPECIKPVERV